MASKQEKSHFENLAIRIAVHYQKIKRDLPWRQTNDPYFVWVSEIVLQQTRVDQGTPYYIALIERFPTVTDLANAKEEEVLKNWQGLGYYSRARNLHAAAKQVVEKFNGKFPSDHRSLLGLKGIGPYTAAAISSICNNEAVATVDGNVYRVISRILGIEDPIDSTAGKRKFQQLADELLDKRDPGTHNQAMMEFGALVCTPNNPSCASCPIMNDCIAFSEGRVADLPFKEKKLTKRDRYFYYFDLRLNGKVWLEQRAEKDIWQNMYQLPMIESKERIGTEEAFKSFLGSYELDQKNLIVERVHEPIKHILSHQLLHISFIQLSSTTQNLNEPPSPGYSMDQTELNEKPLPKPIEEYLNNTTRSVDNTTSEGS